MGGLNTKLSDSDPYVINQQTLTANNPQGELNVAVTETYGIRATSPVTAQQGLTGTLVNPNPNVTIVGQQTIGEAVSGVIPCPEIMQWVKVLSAGVIAERLALNVTLSDYLWNPISRLFEKVTKADIVENVSLYSAIGANGATAKGSFAHPLIQNTEDKKGVPFEKCGRYMDALSIVSQDLQDTFLSKIFPCGRGTVVHLETEGKGHIYCAGTFKEKMFAFHNLKPSDEE